MMNEQIPDTKTLIKSKQLWTMLLGDVDPLKYAGKPLPPDDYNVKFSYMVMSSDVRNLQDEYSTASRIIGGPAKIFVIEAEWGVYVLTPYTGYLFSYQFAKEGWLRLWNARNHTKKETLAIVNRQFARTNDAIFKVVADTLDARNITAFRKYSAQQKR